MSRNLHSNSSAPPLFPLLDQPSINMAAAGSGAPAVAAPVVIWNGIILTGNFNPGVVAEDIPCEYKETGHSGTTSLIKCVSYQDHGIFEDEITAHGNRCHQSPNCVYSWSWNLADESHSPDPFDPT